MRSTRADRAGSVKTDDRLTSSTSPHNRQKQLDIKEKRKGFSSFEILDGPRWDMSSGGRALGALGVGKNENDSTRIGTGHARVHGYRA